MIMVQIVNVPLSQHEKSEGDLPETALRDTGSVSLGMTRRPKHFGAMKTLTTRALRLAVPLLLLAGLSACQSEGETVAVGSDGARADSAVTSKAAFERLKGAAPQDAGEPAPLLEVDVEPLAEIERVEAEVARGWQLQLTASKQQFVLGEPVSVQIALQNISAEAMDATARLSPEFRLLTYTVVTPDGNEHAFHPIAEFCTLPILAKKTFQPGERVSEEVKLFAARGGWMFDAPGDYLVKADFVGQSAQSHHLLSNTLRIQVLPGSVDEQQAARQVMEGQAALLLQWERGDHLTAGLKSLETVAAQYPSTVHAFYAQYVLGNNLAQSFLNGKVERPADPVQAIGHLESARSALYARFDAGMSPRVRENLHEQLINSYRALGKGAAARGVAVDFTRRYASDAAMAPAIERLNRSL